MNAARVVTGIVSFVVTGGPNGQINKWKFNVARDKVSTPVRIVKSLHKTIQF